LSGKPIEEISVEAFFKEVDRVFFDTPVDKKFSSNKFVLMKQFLA